MQNRRSEALSLRVQGKTLDQIAAQLGISHARAHQLIAEGLAAVPVESAEALRSVLGRRIETLYVTTRAIADDETQDVDKRLAAVGKCVLLFDRFAKLFGLDAPVKAELSSPGGAPLALQAQPMPVPDLVAATLHEAAQRPDGAELRQALMDALWADGVRPTIDTDGETD